MCVSLDSYCACISIENKNVKSFQAYFKKFLFFFCLGNPRPDGNIDNTKSKDCENVFDNVFDTYKCVELEKRRWRFIGFLPLHYAELTKNSSTAFHVYFRINNYFPWEEMKKVFFRTYIILRTTRVVNKTCGLLLAEAIM